MATITVTKDAGLNLQSTITAHEAYGGKFEFGKLAFTGDYDTDGVAITFPNFRNAKTVLVTPVNGYLIEWDEANSKLIFWASVGVQVANTVSLAALTAVPYVAIGN